MSTRTLVVMICGLSLPASFAQAATTIFQDDFEAYTASPDPVDWYGGDGSYFPGVPPVGDPWLVNSFVAPYDVRILNLAGGNQGTAGPHGGSNYLQTVFMDQGVYAAASISAANQALVTTNGNLTFDTWIYKNQGSYGGDDRIIGINDVPGSASGRAFDLILKADGTLAYNNGSSLVATGLSSPVDTWQHLIVVADFNTHTYSVTLDAQSTVSGLPFVDGSISTIQNVYTAGIGNYSSKMSLDDMLMTTTAVPEPTTFAMGSMMLVGLVGYAVRKRRS